MLSKKIKMLLKTTNVTIQLAHNCKLIDFEFVNLRADLIYNTIKYCKYIHVYSTKYKLL